MWRGFFVSCRYSVNCWSESLRPNQVFHQNRNGIRQMSQAVTKKRSFWVRDMPGFALADILEDISPQRHREKRPRTTLRHRRRARGLAPDNAKLRIGRGAG